MRPTICSPVKTLTVGSERAEMRLTYRSVPPLGTCQGPTSTGTVFAGGVSALPVCLARCTLSIGCTGIIKMVVSVTGVRGGTVMSSVEEDGLSASGHC